MGADLTVRQKILVAASVLGDESEAFSVEDLIVRSWQLYPEAFSLRGYASKYPDSNRVLAKLSGVDGLCGLGWLEHTNQRMYQVTRKGRSVARQLQSLVAGGAPESMERDEATEPSAVLAGSKTSRGEKEPAPTMAGERSVAAAPKAPRTRKSETKKPKTATVELTAQEIHAVGLIAKSDALRKFLRGSPLSFADACIFWDVSQARPAALQERLEATEALLKRVVESFGAEGTSDARLPPFSTCYGLLNLHRLMLGRFARELDAVRAQRAVG